MLEKALDWLAAKLGIYRVSRGSIIGAVRRAVKSVAAEPGEIAKVGVAAGQSMFNAVMVFPKLVARRGDQLKKLATVLAAARAAHRAALVEAQHYLARTDLPALRTARALVDEKRYLLSTRLRRVHVSPRLYLAVVAMLFGFDSWVFFTMYLDLFDADPAQSVEYAITCVVSAFGALITPLLVLWVADQAGTRLARVNVELRQYLDDPSPAALRGQRLVSLFGKAAGLTVGVILVALVFVGIAVFRFGDHAAGIGAVEVPVWLTATLMGSVPLIATAFAYSRRDPAAENDREVDRSWAEHENTMAGHAARIQATLLAWEEAWRALYALVGEISAEANLSIQNVEHLIVYALDRAALGGAAPFRDEVLQGQAGWPRARYQAMLDGGATSGSYVVNAPAQLSSIAFPVPPWVQDALEIALQALAVNLPGAEHHTADEVTRVLAQAFGPDVLVTSGPPRDVPGPVEPGSVPADTAAEHSSV